MAQLKATEEYQAPSETDPALILTQYDNTQSGPLMVVKKANGALVSVVGPDGSVSGSAVFNVKDYGAKGNGVTNDTSAIQAAINAAGLVSGQIVFPAGRYIVDSLSVTNPVTLVFSGQVSTTLVASAAVTGTLLNIALPSPGVVSVFGGVTIDMTNAGAAAVAVSLSNLRAVKTFTDVSVIANKGIGFQVLGCSGCHFQRLAVYSGTKGIWVHGDDSAELYWTECDITNQSGTMAAAFEVNRTLTTDVGGHYISLLRITREGGTITNGMLFSNTAGSVDFSPVFIRNCVVDNINGGAAISIKQKKNVVIAGSWATTSPGNTNPVILADGCQQVTVGAGTFILADPGGKGISLANGCQNVILDGLTIDGALHAIGLLTGTAVTGLVLGMLLNTAQNLTDSMSRLASAATSPVINGLGVMTSGGGGGAQSLHLIDGAGGGDKFIRMDGGGNLQVINGSFSADILQLTDGGQLSTKSGMSPGNFGAYTGSNRLWQGSGVPASGNGSNGDYYFRTDTPGTASQRIYVKSAGAWVGIV